VGLLVGFTVGRAEGFDVGFVEGRAVGRKDGLGEGRDVGREVGFLVGTAGFFVGTYVYKGTDGGLGAFMTGGFGLCRLGPCIRRPVFLRSLVS
jgi:hypothetical protein